MCVLNEVMKDEIINKLKDKDDKNAYEYTKKLCEESTSSDKYLCMVDEFSKLLDDKSSYVRTRGFILIASQSRWMTCSQMKSLFSKMCVLLNDDKPTVVRQCIKALYEVILYLPEMNDLVVESVSHIDVSRYKESMSSLIEKDIKKLINRCNK